jgi:hypothetical protein
MFRINSTSLILGLAMLFITQACFSSDEDHAAHSEHNEKHATENSDEQDQASEHMFWKQQMVHGYQVTFHVMSADPEIDYGGTHYVMVKIDKDEQPQAGLEIQSQVTFPDGKKENKILKTRGDWYINGYDLGNEGTHQLHVSFTNPDGKPSQAEITYP